MPIRDFSKVVSRARELGPIRVAVAAAEDETALTALAKAEALGIADCILIGDGGRVANLLREQALQLHPLEVIHVPEAALSAKAAARLVGAGEARCLMKGMVGTADFMRGILDPESGLSTGLILSHVALLEVPFLDRLLMSTDGAVTIFPSLEEKVQLVHNMLTVANALQLETPRIAALAATEKVYGKIPATVDAAKLAEMARNGVFGSAKVDGPLGLDGAVSMRAARHKGITSDVAGRADGMICPDLESAIAVVKSAVYLGGVKNAGVVVGAKAPIVLTSRSDKPETKLFSVALACLLAGAIQQKQSSRSIT